MTRIRTFLLLLLFFIAWTLPAEAYRPLLKCTEYKSGEQIEHSRVSSYVQDSKGMLWMGTWIGLCRYDGKEFHFFLNRPDEVPAGSYTPLGSNRILKILLDSRENLWCVNYDQGVYRFDRNTSTYQAVLPLVKDYPAVQCSREKLYAMKQNHAMWIVLMDGTLVRVNDSDLNDNEVLACPPGQKRTVYEIFEDHLGREWILSDHGVSIYKQGQVTSYPYNRIIELNGHCLLIAYPTAQLVEYREDGLLLSIDLPEEVHKIHTIYPVDDHTFALGCDNGLILYDADRHSFLHSASCQKHPLCDVEKIGADQRGRIWFFANQSELYHLNPEDASVTFVPNPTKPFQQVADVERPYMILEDTYGNLWFKPKDRPLCWYDESDATLHPYQECLAEGNTMPVRDFSFYFIDAQKNLWISSGSTTVQLTFGQQQFYAAVNADDPVQEVRSLLAEDSLHVWVGDKQGRLCRYSLETGKYQYMNASGQWGNQPVVLFKDGVYCLYRDSKNRVWIGTRGSGIYRILPQGSGYQFEHFMNNGGKYDLNCDDIYDIYEDEYHRFWIATFGGGINLAQEQNDGTLRFVHAGNELLGYPLNMFDVVRTLCGDGKGRILAGTNNGVLAFSSKFDRLSELSFEVYQAQTPMEKPLQDNMIMRILCDRHGQFYVCSFGRGMSRVFGEGLKDLSFEAIPNREFPAGDVIISAVVQRSGSLWYASECGITCYSPQAGMMWYFNEHNFDRSVGFTECAPLELPDGRILMGMYGGLLIFQSDNLHKSLFAPKIVFTERQYAKDGTVHTEQLNDIDSLIVLPNQRTTTLRFAALDLVPSQLTRYAYWLQRDGESSDPRWVYTVAPEVNFTDLLPGEYSLHIQSTNSDGVWRNNDRMLSVIVVPTFWERWGGWIITLTLVLCAVIVLLWYRHWMHEQQKHVVKQEVTAAKIEMMTRPADQADQEFVQKLMKVLEAHLSDGDLQVNDLADEMNMSRATFYRRLKQSVDMSPNDFIHQVRMRRSAELLVNSDDNISQVAYSVGFNNPKYFSKCFRQDFGVSPAEYRIQKRLNKNEGEQTPIN